MKKLAVFLAFIFVFIMYQGYADAVRIPAGSAVVMDVKSGRLLYAQDGNMRRPMASTTKIMTALVAIENGNLNDIVTVSAKAEKTEGSSLYLRHGDKISLSDLLYGLMLVSGNDAAVAVAQHVGGSVEGFIEMMNDKAAKIGAANTHFANPHGLHDDNHYTTAYDLTLIAINAMKNETFSSIVSTKYHKIEINGIERTIKNKNKILWQYDGGIGVKTGYTKKAGKCLVSAAERDGLVVVCTVLDCGDMFNESMQLMNEMYKTFANYTVVKKGNYLGTVTVNRGIKTYTDVFAPEEVNFVLTESEAERIDCRVKLIEKVRAPLVEGTILGDLQVWLDGELLYETDLCASESIDEEGYSYYLKKIIKKWLSPSAAPNYN